MNVGSFEKSRMENVELNWDCIYNLLEFSWLKKTHNEFYVRYTDRFTEALNSMMKGERVWIYVYI